MIVKLLTEHHLEFLSLKGGCGGSSESKLVKMPFCWKSHVTAHTVYVAHNNSLPVNNQRAFPKVLSPYNLAQQEKHASILQIFRAAIQ